MRLCGGALSAHARERAMIDNLEGGCARAAVRYRLVSRPMFVHCCHCRECQRQTGSAFVLNALIETDRVSSLSGNPEPVAVPTAKRSPTGNLSLPSLQGSGLEPLRGVHKLLFVR